MVLITILTGAYKPTYTVTGGPHVVAFATLGSSHVFTMILVVGWKMLKVCQQRSWLVVGLDRNGCSFWHMSLRPNCLRKSVQFSVASG